jgi:hypothetical protein
MESSPASPLLTIILVEDNPLDVRFIRWVLDAQAFPYELQVITDGEDALFTNARVVRETPSWRWPTGPRPWSPAIPTFVRYGKSCGERLRPRCTNWWRHSRNCGTSRMTRMVARTRPSRPCETQLLQRTCPPGRLYAPVAPSPHHPAKNPYLLHSDRALQGILGLRFCSWLTCEHHLVSWRADLYGTWQSRRHADPRQTNVQNSRLDIKTCKNS